MRFLFLAVFLAGCGSLHVVGPDGAVHEGTFDSVTRTMSMKIRGTEFSGPYVMGGTGASVSTITSTTVVRGRVGTSTGQIFNPGSGGGNGRAMLTSPAGESMVCEFTYQGMTAIGTCQDKAGQYHFQTR